MKSIIKNILWLRLAQLKINDYYKLGYFKIPIHLALGHETIAVCVNKIMNKNDHILLSHRNIHYNMMATKKIKLELNEFSLKKNGLANGKLGSMNLSNEDKNIEYSSSILGNNLPVACGVMLGKKIKKTKGITIVVTGDGAIEEGSFYESLLLAKSLNLPLIFLVENNEWSLGTSIKERRCPIDLSKLSESLSMHYSCLEGNDPLTYINELKKIKKQSIKNNCPSIIEVKLKTLGYWIKQDEDNPNGRFINYHAGPARELKENNLPLIEQSLYDPIFVIKKYVSKEMLVDMTKNIQKEINKECYEISKSY